jgi:hypothetical protein
VAAQNPNSRNPEFMHKSFVSCFFKQRLLNPDFFFGFIVGIQQILSPGLLGVGKVTEFKYPFW